MNGMVLPDFLIVGAARAGTTWLDACLRAHNEIFLPTSRKEVHFFDENFGRGVEWYESFFAEAPERAVIGESTPRYLFNEFAPKRIADTIPEVKLVALLRNPVDRAYSHFGLSVRDRGVALSFEDALEANPIILDMSRYSVQLRRLLDLFEPHRLHFIIYEELIADPSQTLPDLAEFLGVNPIAMIPPESRENPTFVPRHPRMRRVGKEVARHFRRFGLDQAVELGKRATSVPLGQGRQMPAMDPDTRSRLVEEFAFEVTSVEELIGRSLPHWKRAGR